MRGLRWVAAAVALGVSISAFAADKLFDPTRDSNKDLHAAMEQAQREHKNILMDVGGFRDMHRHRRCVQIIQPFTALHGYETPTSGDLGPDVNILAEAGILADYQSALAQAHAASACVAAGPAAIVSARPPGSPWRAHTLPSVQVAHARLMASSPGHEAA